MATEFKYAPMFQLGKDNTEYYLLTKDHVSVSEFEGHPILKIEKEGLTKMANAAFRDVSFLLRRSHNEQVAKMEKLGMNPEEFATYLMLHKYGAPPHGGLGLGLERLTMHLLGAKNVREATMFPRDINRVSP